jgi:dipeptidase E
MRLYLSSYLWGNQPERLFDMLGDNKHVAVITNASDQFPEGGIFERLKPDQAYLAEMGLSSERLDLREYFHDQKKLEDDIKEFGLVWVKGGNAFVLSRAYAQSGLDKLLPKLLEEDRLVYGGYSAGVCVMGPTLKGIELVDDPTVVPEGYNSEIIWEGLNAVPYVIAPHFKSDHPETELIDKSIAYFEEHSIPYKALHDGEAILIDGSQQYTIG